MESGPDRGKVFLSLGHFCVYGDQRSGFLKPAGRSPDEGDPDDMEPLAFMS